MRARWSVSLGVSGSSLFVTHLSHFISVVLVASALTGPGVVVATASAAEQTSAVSPTPPPNRPVTVRWEWWKDPDVKRSIRLSDEKTRKIDAIYTRREIEIQPVVDKIVVEQDKLNHMTNERVADEAAYALQVSQVETLWARWRESRTVMLYRMFLELQPDQYKKLQEIMDRRFSQDGRGRGPGR